MSTRLQIASDLHLEFIPPDQLPTLLDQMTSSRLRPDATILAGDVAPYHFLTSPRGEPACKFLYELSRRLGRIYIVPGNHERYDWYAKEDDDGMRKSLEAIGSFRVHYLHRSVVRVNRTRIVGTTMYWPKPPREVGFITDYSAVHGLVPWHYDEHDKDLAFLREEVKAGDVVVTHLLPSMRSVAPPFEGALSNHFFVNQVGAEIMALREPTLWVHGHTHVPCEYVLGKTHVICNPRGYPREQRAPTVFEPCKLIDV